MSDANNKQPKQTDVSRRRFIQLLGAGGIALMKPLDVLGALVPVQEIANPLDFYPTRDWEKVYRDQYHYDRTFNWVCAPNDTHMCRLRAFVRMLLA